MPKYLKYAKRAQYLTRLIRTTIVCERYLYVAKHVFLCNKKRKPRAQHRLTVTFIAGPVNYCRVALSTGVSVGIRRPTVPFTVYRHPAYRQSSNFPIRNPSRRDNTIATVTALPRQ